MKNLCYIKWLIISVVFMMIGCTTDETVTIESVKVKSADEIYIYYSGSPEDPNRTFIFSVDVELNGKKEIGYTSGYLTYYSSFRDYVEVELRKSIPKGAKVTVRPSEFSEKLYGSVTYVYEG